MKVTDIKSYVMDGPGPGREYVFIKILTDEGIHGWGEATLEMKQDTVVAAVRDLQHYLLGQDPTRIDFLWQRMYRHGFWRGGAAVLSALSGIEHALWDITGKAYGQPVYKLLGGAVRDLIPCYTHCWTPESALAFMEDGWRAFKASPGLRSAGNTKAHEVRWHREAAEGFAALRKACGDDVEFMCDVHGRPRPSAAVRLARALEPFNLLFLEEPVQPDNAQYFRALRAAGLSIDIATGERVFTKWGFRELIEEQLVDVVQPDICHDGGIKETIKIAAMAEAHQILVAPHNPNGPVGTAAAVHAAAVMPNFLILEYATFIGSVRDDCQAASEPECFKARNGRIELPTKPGLGVELDETYLNAHPSTGPKYWNMSPMYNEDGGVADV